MSSDINCQNLGDQINGYDNAGNITGIRPSKEFGGIDHGNDGHNDNNDRVSSPSGISPSGYIQSQELIPKFSYKEEIQ